MPTAAVDSSIEDAFCSNHNPITFSFALGEPKGKGYWKFPDFLTNDATFKAAMVQCIAETLKDNKGMEPGLLWDVVKSSIQGCAIDYLALAKR